MELYRNYPKFCTIWCFIEVLFYAGQLFGWSSILYVLKQEGFYYDLCIADTTHFNMSSGKHMVDETYINIDHINRRSNYSYKGWNNANDTSIGREVLSIDVNESRSDQVYSSVDAAENEDNDHLENSGKFNKLHALPEVPGEGCNQQDARLNLWFSVAICVAYLMCSIMGPILRKAGMRKFRLILLTTYIVGALCLGFATPETPWLVCPGLCCIGVAGMALYSTNIQVSFLFPNVQSTITSVFVGLYDVSTVITYLMKIAFDGGIPRKYFYVGLATLHALLIGTSTLFFLPCVRIKTISSTGKSRLETHEKTKTGETKTEETKTEETKSLKDEYTKTTDEGRSPICRSLLSCEYMLHVYWMCVQGLRFVSFIGFFNVWIENKFDGNDLKDNYYLGVFSFVTISTVITAVTAGLLHDCQRRKYLSAGDYRRRRLPIILPLTVTSLMSVIITSLIFVRIEAFLYIIFVLFTIYRSYLFSFEITFLNDIYPLTSFSVLFGVLHSSAGVSGMIQYPLFQWYKSYPSAPHHVNMLMICLAVSSLAHPVHLWYKCRRHRNDNENNTMGIEIYI